ncbi:hypothetical protein HDU82_009059 [Entophlyctis luteolus]|nr:hypothetical protein HDU82_009059 [Entophlyctis luteolus]
MRGKPRAATSHSKPNPGAHNTAKMHSTQHRRKHMLVQPHILHTGPQPHSQAAVPVLSIVLIVDEQVPMRRAVAAAAAAACALPPARSLRMTVVALCATVAACPAAVVSVASELQAQRCRFHPASTFRIHPFPRGGARWPVAPASPPASPSSPPFPAAAFEATAADTTAATTSILSAEDAVRRIVHASEPDHLIVALPPRETAAFSLALDVYCYQQLNRYGKHVVVNRLDWAGADDDSAADFSPQKHLLQQDIPDEQNPVSGARSWLVFDSKRCSSPTSDVYDDDV